MSENISVRFGRWWTFCTYDVNWVVVLNRRAGTIFQHGGQGQTQVLSCNMIRNVDFGPTP